MTLLTRGVIKNSSTMKMDITALETRLEGIKHYIDHVENSALISLEQINDEYLYSAQNLLRYLALRSQDIREIQSALASFGISSLGTSPGYVSENIARSLGLLSLIQGKSPNIDLKIASGSFVASDKLLMARSRALFGSSHKETRARIMVTMPDEIIDNISLTEQYLNAGMTIARINLSHGDYYLWDKMLDTLITAGDKLSIGPSIFMDLPGPKIRVDNIFVIDHDNNHYNKVARVSLTEGEHLELMKESQFLELESYEAVSTKVITVLLPQIIEDIKIGHRIFFDDGRIEAEVISKSLLGAIVKIKKATKKKLATGKGINLPDTHLSLPSLTQNDLELLPYACKNADIIGYSFVRTPEDVALLYSKLSDINDKNTGVVFKIETREAFENLPGILLEAMKRPNIGVMIARGDLAVEMGFERISEVKNQIMSICEAAHVPVIWATQVLENMAKKGLATRAEISDVILSGKAECVMLNKGPFMVDTIITLNNILEKMDGHYNKNRNTLRALEVARKSIEKIQKGYDD
jgi:pyruvate kinase